MKFRNLVLSACLALSSTLAFAQTISFGIIATDSATAQRDKWEPFFKDMEKKTGLTIKPFYATDYAGVIEAMRFNKIQVAWYGNKAAMEAVDRANGEIFAQLMYADGTFGYEALLITHKDSPYQTLDDIFKNGKNVNFGIGDPNSTSGFLVPSYYIFSERQVEPREVFKTVRNGSHGANIQAVLAKQLDVATNNTEDMGRLKVTKPELYEQLRIIWTSPLIPSDPFVWRTDLDPAVKEKIRTFVLSYAQTDAQEKEILKNIYNYGGFRASNNDQLKPIRQLELFKDRQKILSAQGLNQAEKDAKIKEIDQALAQLQ